MPSGTHPGKLEKAARHFLQEQFGLTHRYAMDLHAGQKHPYVHLVVKTVSEQGVRLNINREMLQQWREDFARSLRIQGIEANASQRLVRGRTITQQPDGIHRAMLRRDSSHWRERVAQVADELHARALRIEPGKQKLLEIRKAIDRGWWAVSTALSAQGESELAAKVVRFIEQMPPARTDKEQLANTLFKHMEAKQVAREQDPTR